MGSPLVRAHGGLSAGLEAPHLGCASWRVAGRLCGRLGGVFLTGHGVRSPLRREEPGPGQDQLSAPRPHRVEAGRVAPHKSETGAGYSPPRRLPGTRARRRGPGGRKPGRRKPLGRGPDRSTPPHRRPLVPGEWLSGPGAERLGRGKGRPPHSPHMAAAACALAALGSARGETSELGAPGARRTLLV